MSRPAFSGKKTRYTGAGGGGGGKIGGTRLELGIARRKKRVLCIVHYLLNKTGFLFLTALPKGNYLNLTVPRGGNNGR
jgi:hypothetical protein